MKGGEVDLKKHEPACYVKLKRELVLWKNRSEEVAQYVTERDMKKENMNK